MLAHGSSENFFKLGIPEAVHVSELLNIPTVVAGTDLVGVFAASMGSLMVVAVGTEGFAHSARTASKCRFT